MTTITYALVETHDDGTETTRDIIATVVESREHLEMLLDLATQPDGSPEEYYLPGY